MIKIILYVLIIPLTIWALDGVNINVIFKKNRPYQARMIYMMLIFSLSYLFVNFLYDFLEAVNF